ncbi:ABC transporter substrate-binding protein [Agaribacterium haliotis]|uniref:ABC transporter substrate-binding protein n=1 Tax=Agaribacterium haliotis TaxID=2013869 RepID=UPI000BB59C93|nr:ABC transporter substrate-binding protein [Agaribacterium haliotis]
MRWIGVSLLLWFCGGGLSAEELTLAQQIFDGDHRRQVSAAFKLFHKQNPDIKLKLRYFRNDGYEQRVADWLASGQGPDVLFWYGGQHTAQFARSAKIHDLTSVLSRAQLQRDFAHIAVDAVSVDERVYAVPGVINLWAVYYRPSIFQKYGLKPPQTWPEVLNQCRLLRKQGVDLFAFGSRSAWATHAWFDYLNLRLNGLAFYRRLLAGEIAFTDPRVINALEHWRSLLDQQCMTANHAHYTVDDALPRLMHGMSAAILSYGRVEMSSLAEHDIAVMPFPEIKPGLKAWTVAPVDVYLVPAYTQINSTLVRVLKFLASETFQLANSRHSSRHPARLLDEDSVRMVESQARALIQSSPGGIQYFDRDVPLAVARFTPEVFVKFLQHRDVERCAKELESLRQQALRAGAWGPGPH